jgi:hypothetical protein
MSDTNGKPRVYSYLRFSTTEQGLGDSERRQLQDAQAWVDREGLQLDEQLADRGLSWCPPGAFCSSKTSTA